MDRATLRRWSVAWGVIGTVVMVLLSYLVAGAPWRWIAVILIAAGIIASLPAVWSTVTGERAMWDREVRHVLGVMAGAGLFMLGIAALFISMVDLEGAPWAVVAIVSAGTFVGLYGAASFLMLALVIRSNRAGSREDWNRSA